MRTEYDKSRKNVGNEEGSRGLPTITHHKACGVLPAHNNIIDCRLKNNKAFVPLSHHDSFTPPPPPQLDYLWVKTLLSLYRSAQSNSAKPGNITPPGRTLCVAFWHLRIFVYVMPNYFTPIQSLGHHVTIHEITWMSPKKLTLLSAALLPVLPCHSPLPLRRNGHKVAEIKIVKGSAESKENAVFCLILSSRIITWM